MNECSSAALVLIAVLACQTGSERRSSTEPTDPHKAVQPVAPSTDNPAAAALPTPPQAPLVPLTKPKEPLNVILLTLADWRADMPWAGYDRAIAPQLSLLAAESGVWENHRAVSSHTPQALAALLSSRYVSSLYRDGAVLTSFPAEDTFLPELLQAKGVRTIGVQANTYFDKGRGFEQGFDVWEVVPGAGTNLTTDAQVSADKQASRLIELLGQAQNTERQFFAWAHFMDLKDPYLAHADVPEFGKQPRDRYDAQVYFMDRWLGKVLEFARRQVWWGRTAIIITGDHGEALGEHAMSKPSAELWDVLLHTPLLIHAPGAKPARIPPARSQIDLAPTVIDLMGLPRVAEFRGQSLLPELYGAPAGARPALLFELCEDTENVGLRALLVGDDKLIVPSAGGPERLFDVKLDPRELQDVAEAHVQKLHQLAVRLEREWSRIPSIEPHGGMKLRSGRLAQGPERAER